MTRKSGDAVAGDISEGKQPRSLAAVLGAGLIQDTIASFIDYVETGVMAFERDGSLIGEVLCGSSFCQMLMDAVMRDPDGIAAETFREATSKCVNEAVDAGEAYETTIVGISFYSAPVIAFGEVIGVISGGVSEVSGDEKSIREAVEASGLGLEQLSAAAREAFHKPDYIYDAARKHLARLAGTVGRLYEDALEKELADAKLDSYIQKLEGTSSFLQSLLDGMAEGAYTCDLDGNFTYLNPAAEKITGYSEAELLGRRATEMVVEGDRDLLAAMRLRRSDGLVDRYEFEIIRKDGRQITLMQTASPLYESGEIVGVIGVAIDITSRKQLQRQLEQQNQRLLLLQSIIARSVSALSRGKALKTLVHEVADTFGYDFCNIFMVNDDGSKLQLIASHGYDEEFIRRMNDGDAFNFKDREFLKGPAAVAYVQGEQSAVVDAYKMATDRRLTEAARQYKFHSVAATPLEYRDERLGVLTVYTREVHEFDEQELGLLTSIAAQAATIAGSSRTYDRLAASEERYRELYDKAADWMYTLDSDGVIVECNETMAEALELTEEEIVGEFIYDLEAATDRESAIAAIAGFREQNASDMIFTSERVFIGGGGKALTIELHARSVANEAGDSFQWRVVGRDVTEKKESEQRLKLLAAAVENAHEAVIICDLNGDLLSINDAGATMLGLSVDGSTGLHMGEFWSEENPAGLRDEIYVKTLKGGWEGQMQYRRADGTSIPVFVSSALVDDAGGKPFAMVGIARDISVEQRMTAEILQRNRELAVLNSVATITSSTLDLKELLQGALDKVIGSMGYDAGMIFVMDPGAQTLTPMVTTEGIPEDMRSYVKSIKVGEGHSGRIAETGSPVFVDDYKGSPFRVPGMPDAAPVLSIGGVPLVSKEEVMGVLVVSTATRHEFKDSEKALLGALGNSIGVAIENARLFDDITQAKNEWETTFDAMTNGVSIHGPDFTILRANRALAQMLDVSPEELIGKKCYEVFHGGSGPSPICPQQKALEEGISHSIISEEPYLGRTLAIASDPIIDAHGRITGAVHDVRDITEQEHLREQLGQSEKIRALGEMAGGVAHDFNNFLTVILGNAQLMLTRVDSTGLDADFRESLETVQRAAADAAETVRRIQEFTRVRTTRSFTTVDVNRVLRNSVEVASPRWRDEATAVGRSIEIKTDLSKVPPVNGNESELGEVFVNLILNATDALVEGGTITLTTDVEPGSQWIRTTIADDGKGMDEEERKRIFEPFFTTKGLAGSGLGLSVAYGIVNRHGGDIMVESHMGSGTRFTVRLPVATVADLSEAAEQTLQAELAQAAAENGAPSVRGKVLVIDDEMMIRTLIGDVLTGMGHEAVTAASGSDGMDLFTAAIESGAPFDLVLTDLGMPEMSGWEVVDEVKRFSPETPVALITGWGDQLDPKKMKQSRVDRVIAKPFRVDDIKLLLSQALSKSQPEAT
ncbi:MAG: PAS domain S-box protein [Thermoleophilia bacterium]